MKTMSWLKLRGDFLYTNPATFFNALQTDGWKIDVLRAAKIRLNFRADAALSWVIDYRVSEIKVSLRAVNANERNKILKFCVLYVTALIKMLEK
jgi:hypothetical protein